MVEELDQRVVVGELQLKVRSLSLQIVQQKRFRIIELPSIRACMHVHNMKTRIHLILSMLFCVSSFFSAVNQMHLYFEIIAERTFTRTFVCLAYKDQNTVPSALQKLALSRNGLGEKKVVFPCDVSGEVVKDVLYE